MKTMKQMLKKPAALLLAAALCLPLASCGEKKTALQTSAETTSGDAETMDTNVLPTDFSYTVTDAVYSDGSAEGSDIDVTYPVLESANAVMSDINDLIFTAATDFSSFGGDLSDVKLDRSYSIYRYGDILSVVFEGQCAITGLAGITQQKYAVMFNMATGKRTTLAEITGATQEKVKSCLTDVYENQHGKPLSEALFDVQLDSVLSKMDTANYLGTTSYLDKDSAFIILPVTPEDGAFTVTEIPVSELIG